MYIAPVPNRTSPPAILLREGYLRLPHIDHPSESLKSRTL